MSETCNGIESLDHPVVAVNDLEASRNVYEKLGFTVPPRGSHIEWGTGNLCIMFPDDYLEMRGIIDPDRFVMHMDEHLEKFGEGLMGVAFRTDDVARSHSSLIEHDVETPEPRRLTRNFEHPEGWTQPSFELCVPAADAIEGLMHVVVLQHLTPELIRRPDYLQHANTVSGVNSMSGVIFDKERVAAKMTRLLGDEAVETSEDGVHLTVPTGQRIHLLLPPEFENAFDGSPVQGEIPTLSAMELRVQDLAATKATLTANGVNFVQAGQDSIRVAASHTCGVLLDFTEAQPS
jgi:hypothetical protein